MPTSVICEMNGNPKGNLLPPIGFSQCRIIDGINLRETMRFIGYRLVPVVLAGLGLMLLGRGL